MVEWIEPTQYDEEYTIQRLAKQRDAEYIERKIKADKKASIRSKRYYNKNYILTKDMTDEQKEKVMDNIAKRRAYNRMRYKENKEVREKSKQRQQKYRDRQRDGHSPNLASHRCIG